MRDAEDFEIKLRAYHDRRLASYRVALNLSEVVAHGKWRDLELRIGPRQRSWLVETVDMIWTYARALASRWRGR